MQHSNYAIAYLNAARHISHDTVLEQKNSVDMHEVSKVIFRQQREALQKMLKIYPKIREKVKKPHSTGWI